MQHKPKREVYLEDIRRSLCNPGFIVGVLCLTIMLMRTVWTFVSMPQTATVMEICAYPMALSGFTVFSASFPSWGYGNQFYKEEKTKYCYYISSRMSWREYLKMRILSVCVSGGLSIAIPLACVFFFSYCMGKKEIGDLFSGMQVRESILQWGIPVTLMVKTGLGALFGMFWALIGFLSSMVIPNKYSPYLIPFILNQFFWILFSQHPKLNPVYLVRGEDLDSYGLSALILILYCIAAMLLIVPVFRRRALL